MRYFKYLILLIFFIGCSKPIVIKYLNIESDKISTFGNNNLRNFFIDRSISPNPKFNWNGSTHGSFGNSSFLAYDSLIIVPDLSGNLTVFHKDTGKNIGELKYKGEIAQTPLLIKSNLIFIVNNLRETTSTLYIYSIIKGEEIEEVELEGKFNTELIFVKNFIYVISDLGTLYKIDLKASVEWKKEYDIEVQTNPAADDENIFIATTDGKILKIELQNGIIKSENKISSGFQSGISMDEISLYVGDIKGNCFKIKKDNLNTLWKFDTASKIVQNPVIDNENLFIGNLGGNYFSLNKISGKLNWEIQVDGLFNVTPLVFSNIIVQPNLLRRIHFIDKNSGEILNQLEFDLRCRTSPIYFNNSLYFGVDKGEVYCYSLKEK